MALNASVTRTVNKKASQKFRRAQRKRLEDAADMGFAVSQEQVPVDRGTLQQSGFTPRWVDGRLVWGYRANHAKPIEFGTDPFWPPIRPLREWAERVAGDPGLAYYVQQKIASEGIDPQPYVRPGRQRMISWLRGNSFNKYLNREL